MPLDDATVHISFVFAACVCCVVSFGRRIVALLCGKAQVKAVAVSRAGVAELERTYLAVYLLMMAGDWMQGPYMYALYDAYGFEHEQIAALFVAGFASSMLFGTVAGSLADTLGRKRGALAYVVIYAASCLTKHWRSFRVLMLGRVLGGVSTSLLFSVFDAWLVSEHSSRGLDPETLSGIFANAQAGNSIVAIVSGFVGHWAASLAPMRVLVHPSGVHGPAGGDGAIMFGGYCAPFDIASLLLGVGALLIVTTWSENYGEQPGGKEKKALRDSVLNSLRKGVGTIARDRRVALVGLISACFEAAMYSFVFEWTPAVTSSQSTAPKPPYGSAGPAPTFTKSSFQTK